MRSASPTSARDARKTATHTDGCWNTASGFTFTAEFDDATNRTAATLPGRYRTRGHYPLAAGYGRP